MGMSVYTRPQFFMKEPQNSDIYQNEKLFFRKFCLLLGKERLYISFAFSYLGTYEVGI